MAKRLKNTSGQFGTTPVFMASICTILGAILFLRFGYSVGHVGFIGALGIILLGHAVTIPTAMAVAEIATNKKVEGGGDYYVISRSFGLNIGGAIGIALYFSQAISIAFYIIAFAEAFAPFGTYLNETYNLGNSLYKNNLPQEARFNFSKSLDKLESKEELHKAFHNLGNTYMQEENYQGAVDNFKKALLNNPDDEETRYNYVLAKELLKNQNNNKDKKDNKDNKDNKDKEKNKDQNQDKKDKDQEKQDKKDDKSKSENKPSKQDISPQQLKNILEAMSKEEKKVQEKINKKKFKGNPKSNKKDW